MKWFKHDSNAQSDAKLEKLRIRYGMEGYGLYWYCLELIVGSVEAHNVTFELEHDAEIISHRTGLHQDQVQEIMKYMVSLGLFEDTGGHITCFKIAKRLDTSMTSNPELRKIIKQFGESHDPVMMSSRIGHDPVMPEEKRREEKRREENIGGKRNGTHKFVPPTLQEVQEYCRSRSKGVDPEKFVDFYTAKGWMVGKNKMKDWKAAVRTWERSSGNENQQQDYRGGI